MTNFKKYTMVVRRDQTGFAYPALKVRQKGDIVKFEDIKEFLKKPTNSDMVPCPKYYRGGKCHGDPWRTLCGSEHCMVKPLILI